MEIWKPRDKKWRHNDITKNNGKQWGDADLSETKQIIYHSKGIDDSYPKMYFLLNFSHYVKSCGHFCQILDFLWCPLTKYGHVMWPKKQMSKKCYFFLILDLILGKVKKFLVESSLLQKLSAKNLTGASPSAFRVNGKITPFNVKKQFVSISIYFMWAIGLVGQLKRFTAICYYWDCVKGASVEGSAVMWGEMIKSLRTSKM